MLQIHPDRPGFAQYDVDLASAEMPCGAGWLANCLLELDVSLWKPWAVDDSGHWEHLGGREYRYALRDSPWSRVLPALRENRTFRFRDAPSVRAHHFWPGVYPAPTRTILFVRDPRDALLSAWHRMRRIGGIASDVDFIAFIRSRYFHYPLSWSGYLLVFLRVWRAWLASRGGVVVRFEDYRRDPIGTLQPVLGYLDITESPERIAQAVAASTFERVQAAESRLLAERVVDIPLLRGEPPGEYARVFDSAMHAAIDPRYADICAWLGYAPPPACAATIVAAAHADVDDVLHAVHIAGLGAGEDGWLACALRAALV